MICLQTPVQNLDRFALNRLLLISYSVFLQTQTHALQMLSERLKCLIVIIFLFALVQKTGYEILSFINGQSTAYELLIADKEDSSKEKQDDKEKTLKEYWICSVFNGSMKLSFETADACKLLNDPDLAHSFYPPVPTPPPDVLFF